MELCKILREGNTMKIGDLVSVNIDGMSLCLVTGFHFPVGGVCEMVEVFYMLDNSHWSTASHRVELVNEAD